MTTTTQKPDSLAAFVAMMIEPRAAFVAKKHRIDSMLKRLQKLNDDHFNLGLDGDVTWKDVDNLERCENLLRQCYWHSQTEIELRAQSPLAMGQ